MLENLVSGKATPFCLQVKNISPQTVYTEEDFSIENYRDWGLSAEDLRRVKELMIGEPVEPADFTDSELKSAGYKSWKRSLCRPQSMVEAALAVLLDEQAPKRPIKHWDIATRQSRH